MGRAGMQEELTALFPHPTELWGLDVIKQGAGQGLVERNWMG